MKLGLGLYRHMLRDEEFAFARQCSCTDLIIHLANYYSNDRDCLQMVPTYFHILGMKAPRFIRRFHQNTDESIKTAFRMGLCTGLDNLVRSLDDTLR